MTRVPPFLGEFSNQDAAWFIEVGFRRNVPAGEAIILEGEPVAELFVILKGSFSVSSRQVKGMPYIRLEAGEIVGEMTFVDRSNPPLSSVRAEVDSEVLRIPRAALDEKLAADAGFRARFHKVVAEFTVHRLRNSWLPPPPEPPGEPPGNPPEEPPEEPPGEPRRPRPRKPRPPKDKAPDPPEEESPEKRMWYIIKKMLDGEP